MVDYYCYCEVGFTTRILGGASSDWLLSVSGTLKSIDHIVTFVREGFEEYGCDILS